MVEAEADDVNLLEEEGDVEAEENTDDEEQLPAAGVEGVPPAVPRPAPPASDSVRLSRLMDLYLVNGSGSVLKRL